MYFQLCYYCTGVSPRPERQLSPCRRSLASRAYFRPSSLHLVCRAQVVRLNGLAISSKSSGARFWVRKAPRRAADTAAQRLWATEPIWIISGLLWISLQWPWVREGFWEAGHCVFKSCSWQHVGKISFLLPPRCVAHTRQRCKSRKRMTPKPKPEDWWKRCPFLT